MKTCAIYARVSTKGQSIEKQLDTLPKFAKEQGWEIYNIYTDNGISGASSKRVKFNELLNSMKEKKFEILLVESQDRISRDDNLEEIGKIFEVARKNNITLASPSEGQTDLNTFGDRLSAVVKQMIAAEEREKIKNRMLGGRKHRAQKGIPPVPAKQLPYGRIYNKDTGQWSLNPVKQKEIEMCVDAYLAGRSMKELTKVKKDDVKPVDLYYPELMKIFRSRLGDTWYWSGIEFKVPR